MKPNHFEPNERAPDQFEPAPLETLTARIGRAHARQRLGLESEHEVLVLNRPGAHFFYPENWYSLHSVIRNCLRIVGLYGRAQRNACDIRVRHNPLSLAKVPAAFAGFRILHLSDLHLDMSPRNASAVTERVRDLDYDLCVLTGDYRAKTFGPCDQVVSAFQALRPSLKDPVYAILGNHDTLRLVPELEALDIRVLLNESAWIERAGERIHLAGIDDAHYYQVHNLAKAAAGIPDEGLSILLSHTPEVYRHAAHAGFDIFLCGHTHGGQICLPSGIALTWDARCPRRLSAGPWRYRDMIGYTSVGAGTSVVNARLNCPPEVTLHELRRAPG
ncbi:metallophosphoesterase [Thiorhodococcus minor]|uniref:Metallophosphoesterase n=1 Tax=Thiorhodococcus minor TaxID=57489 RepID=A0A6M0K9C8_9GAMM|nr:metallophosphoesterase [Thiorhodococcus minor]NEV65105.1 metallophosphoesterase [Thiorhodococcus minor]